MGVKRTPIGRKAPLRAGRPPARTSTLRGDPTEWQNRSRDTARTRPGRAPNSTLPAVGPRKADDRFLERLARGAVWARDRGACQFPHHLDVMAGCPCSAPWADWPPINPDDVDNEPVHAPGRPPGWRPDPRNRGTLQLCHVIPRGLCGLARRWDPHNLFVGCDAANTWAEDHTGPAFATGRHGHTWDHVHEGKVTDVHRPAAPR